MEVKLHDKSTLHPDFRKKKKITNYFQAHTRRFIVKGFVGMLRILKKKILVLKVLKIHL